MKYFTQELQELVQSSESEAVKKNSYWLIQNNSFTGPVELVLFFGFLDNESACDEVAIKFKEEGEKYYCLRVN
jgi:hypothetical protein